MQSTASRTLSRCGLQQCRRQLTSTAALHKKREWDLSDPKQLELYKLYRPERVTPKQRGIELLKTAGLNKVSAF